MSYLAVESTTTSVSGIVVVNYTKEVSVKVGGSFTVNITLENQTSNDQNIYIKLIDNNGNVQDQVTDTLNAGEQKQYQLKGTAPNTVNRFEYKIEYGVQPSSSSSSSTSSSS